MTLRNFDTELDQRGVSRIVTSTDLVVDETVTVTPRRSEVGSAFLGKPEGEWSWGDLRDYVVGEIQERFGPFFRESFKEAGIFKSFLSRHGEQAPAIARFVFEVNDGYWQGQPITVNRFCKKADPFFADQIKDRLVETSIEPW